MKLIAGVDEAGRGPLAGPVCAAAVILDEANPIIGLADSKKLSAKQRAKLEQEILKKAKAFCVAWASVEEIDQLNIFHATMLAMKRAIEGLAIQPQKALIDGNKVPKVAMETEAIVKGDAKVAAISAASILAKEARDRWMNELHQKHPEYGFAWHKGYPTAEHAEALKKFGALPEHRKSFGPVAEILEAQVNSTTSKRKPKKR